MPEHRWRSEPILAETSARAVGAVGLAAVAVVHIVDLPDTWKETPLIGYGYLALIGAALLAAFLMISVRDARVWLLAALVAFAAIAGYVLSRTTGLPTDSFDIGNWDCDLGIAAISTETLIVLLALWQLLQTAHQPLNVHPELQEYDAVPTPARRGPLGSI